MKKLFILCLLLNLLMACGESGEFENDLQNSSNQPTTTDNATSNSSGSQEDNASNIPPSVDSDVFMDEVAAYNLGEDSGYGSLSDVLGPPHGAGENVGSTESVLSLGTFGSITLCSDTPILNGEGPDFIVFENAFFTEFAENGVFAELGEVSVIQDPSNLDNYLTFDCNTTTYEGCAGATPVYANVETNSIDPTDPEAAGGDAFDLEDLGLDYAMCVRIDDIDVGGFNGGTTGGFDLDAISIIYQ